MRVFELDTPSQGYKTTFILPSTNIWNKFCFHCKSWKCRGTSKDCILRAENSDHFWRGGWQLYASFSQSFLLQFWKSQCPFGSKYPEFSKTPPTFAFWMSLRVVMAIFPLNDIFFGTLCIHIWHYIVHWVHQQFRKHLEIRYSESILESPSWAEWSEWSNDGADKPCGEGTNLKLHLTLNITRSQHDQ